MVRFNFTAIHNHYGPANLYGEAVLGPALSVQVVPWGDGDRPGKGVHHETPASRRRNCTKVHVPIIAGVRVGGRQRADDGARRRVFGHEPAATVCETTADVEFGRVVVDIEHAQCELDSGRVHCKIYTYVINQWYSMFAWGL